MQTPYRILLVDDNPMMVKTLADILKLKGYRVETAHSALQALEIVEETASGDIRHRQCALGCVLSDVKMPGMTGIELFRRIHANFPDLPVLLMTAYTEEEQLQTSLAEGVIEVLAKPLNIPGVLELLRKICEQGGNAV